MAQNENYIALAQARENSTNAVSVLSAPTGHKDRVYVIMFCNTTAAEATFRLFFDADGTTYDESTALYWNASLPAESTLTIELDKGIILKDASNLAYRSSVANAITISVWGSRERDNT